MKKKMFFAVAFIALGLSYHADAQITINIGAQPVWGPVGYDYVQNYYLPDIDAYYDVQRRVYVYDNGGRWVTSPNIPSRYSSFDLYSAHKVVINEAHPWMHHDKYRQQYVQYKGRHDQHPIRDAHEEKYWENPNHPEHGKWHGNPHNNGNGNGQGNGNDKNHRNDRGNGNGNHNKEHGNGKGNGRH